jgi:formate hydrogenlyase subunit 3/multisubunit Na+/H+ antiporter MnhD subunit
MEDIIGQIELVTYLIVCVGFPLFVIVQSIINLARATDGQGAIVLKAVVVLGIWLVISMIVIFIPIMYVFEPGRGVNRDVANRNVTIIMLVLTFFYILIGLALGYWVRLQPGWKTLRKARNEA